MSHGVVIGVDVGGTFTDVVAVDPSGELVITKVPSDPEGPERAVIAAIEALGTHMGVDLPELLREASVIHGSTLAINTLLTRTGAKTGLLCTAGFRDVTEIRTGYRHERFDLRAAPPVSLVPRHLRLEVSERIDENGKVLRPLIEGDIVEACSSFEAEKVEAVAVCLLWSFMNRDHEERVRDVCKELLPGAYVTASCDVLPEIREYDRWSTTVLNAYLGPKFEAYVDRLESGLRELGLSGAVQYLQSNGGVAGREEIVRVPSRTLMSGPATGPVAARYIASREGWDNAVCIDMGGTSFDASAVTGGAIRESRPVDIDTVRVGFPMVDVQTVGGGGGSIAHFDSGILRVGPHSAGSYPGPAAYGLGGTQPTVTDADLLLGLYEEGPIAGGVLLAKTPAQVAVGTLASEMGMSTLAAAEGIWRVLTDQLAEVVRDVTIAEGRDPREYVMVAGGGAGPAHCCAIADRLGITDVLVPRAASALCAFGSVLTDEIHDLRRSYPTRLDSGTTFTELNEVLTALQSEVLKRAGAGPGGERGRSRSDLSTESEMSGEVVGVELRSGLELRYQGQLWEILVWLDEGFIDAAAVEEAINKFHDRHHELYAYSEPETPCEAVGLAVRATVRRDIQLATRPALEEGRKWRPVGTRPITGLWAGSADELRGSKGEDGLEAAIYHGEDAVVGLSIDGPALIKEPLCVIAVGPDWRAKLTNTDTFHLSRS